MSTPSEHFGELTRFLPENPEFAEQPLSESEAERLVRAAEERLAQELHIFAVGKVVALSKAAADRRRREAARAAAAERERQDFNRRAAKALRLRQWVKDDHLHTRWPSHPSARAYDLGVKNPEKVLKIP